MWNPPDFIKSARFHVKSARYHEIHWILWNPADFMWNPLDFERPIARNGKPYVFSLDYEDKAVKIYKHLLKCLPHFQIEALLRMEDKEGLKPLELAVHSGCLCLCKAILNAENVYLAKLKGRGLAEKAWYDVTEYENIYGCCDRRSKNPLFFLTLIDRKVLKNPKALFELRNGILHKWSEVKFKSNCLLILIWFILRLMCFSAFYCLVAIDSKVFLQKLYSYNNYPASNTTYEETTYENGTNNNSTQNDTQCPGFKSWYFNQCPWW